MEILNLKNQEEIKHFQEYLSSNPDVIISSQTKNNVTEYVLTTNQKVLVPDLKYENKLVFGKSPTSDIVNISFKDDKIYTYFKDGTSKVEDYFPFILSSVPGQRTTELKGNQYYKYIAKVPIQDYKVLYEKHKYNNTLWFPRSIEEGYMMLTGNTYFKGLKLNDVSYLSFDIENLDDKKYPHTDLVVLISNTYRSNTGVITKRLFSIKDYSGSVEMVNAWCDWVRDINPDVMVGHNIFLHDLRVLNLVTPLKLGRDGSVLTIDEKDSKFRKDGQQQYKYKNMRVHGRELVDSWMMSIRYDIGRKFPSYGLKAIEKHLNLQPDNRIEWDFDKNPVFKTINDPVLFEQFKLYANDDADSPIKMIDIMLPTVFYFNQSVPKTLQQMTLEATGSQLDSMMIRSYLQDGYSQPRTSQKTPFEGAISLGVSGIFNHVKKVDCLSMYPSIMLQYKIYDKKKDPNGNLLSILTYFRDERVKNKRLSKETKSQYYEDLQQTQKVGANSIYGFLGSGYLLYNYPEGAAEVTKYGRDIISKATMWATGHEIVKDIKKIVHEGDDNQEIQYEWTVGKKVQEGKGYTVCNIDTDGLAITNGEYTSKEDFEKEISELNSIFPEYIKFENDGQFSKFIVVRAKNYIMLEEGQTKYKLKGSSILSQNKEIALKEMLTKMIEVLLEED